MLLHDTRLDGTCPLLSDEIEQAVLKDGHIELGLTKQTGTR